MTHDFRADAQRALERGKVELASGDDQRLKYAALELRMAMEALTYDRAQSCYREELPPEAYEKWQPKHLMICLLEIDPHADTPSELRIREENEDGSPKEEVVFAGAEQVLDLGTIRAHYDALGSYLHIPTLKQIRKPGIPNLVKLRKRCEEIVTAVEKALNSSVRNIRMGKRVAKLDKCLRCERSPVFRRIPSGADSVEAQCFGCQARYRVVLEREHATFEPCRVEFECTTDGCAGTNIVWTDRLRLGERWTCDKCKQVSMIMLGATGVQSTP